ncbi:sec-independent translocase [Streptomyces sp. 549]|uniref:sec-independent translocase n=1 Tax=Streptomyces sp. 549 TaxID=3049076 RepID=UPI0024C2A742|nr:sec-independent translocase [Streptomyces sp. 549]MDK1476266.1 sec-independent translocase [Streptomyces sp. 549]
MFFDIGSLEFVVLIVLAVLVFGPEKLPKMIQDVASFVRKIRQFSDSARDDIRSELGPEFKDFEFQDLHPKRFAQKHLMENDELGLKEIRNGFDMRKELAEVSDAVNGRESAATDAASGAAETPPAASAGGTADRLRKKDAPAAVQPPPYDSDAT